MKRKSVFLCIPTLSCAGAERFVTELACSVDRDRFDVKVLVTKIFDTESAFYQKLVSAGITVVDATAKHYLKQIGLLVKLLNKDRPEIVHTNVSSALYMIIPIALAKGKIAHLFTVHSMGYRIFNGFKKRLMQFCFHKKMIVPVAICDAVKKSLCDAYALSENMVELVYNGVDTKAFQADPQVERTGKTFINVGTLYYIKNQKFLIDAFRIVTEKDDEAKLLLVGDGEMREELESYSESLGLDKKISFLGKCSNVVQHLSSADVYCCSSLVEGFSLSSLEAMACSLPVVTTRAGGMVDIVRDGVNGFVVDFDVEQFAEKMLILLKQKALREEMAKNAVQIAVQFDLSECAKGYELLYEKYAR